MPTETRPSERLAMLYYTSSHQHPKLTLHLIERNSSSLHQIFSDAKEVEDNLQACGNLVAQNRDEDSKHEQVYGHKKVDLHA